MLTQMQRPPKAKRRPPRPVKDAAAFARPAVLIPVDRARMGRAQTRANEPATHPEPKLTKNQGPPRPSAKVDAAPAGGRIQLPSRRPARARPAVFTPADRGLN